MALVLKDRVKESTTTTGTGTLTLLGPTVGYQAFSVIGDGNTCYYAISAVGSSEWEVGVGTYTSSGTTLSRDTILESSTGGGAIDLSAGVKDVYVVYPAEKGVWLDASGNVVQNQFTSMNVTGTATINVATLTSGTISTTPASGTDIANKQYVDTMTAAGIHFHEPVRVESPINLNATYNNGTAGVGATLTNAGTQTALVIDGIAVSVNDRVLVYEQTTQTQNGIYTVTNIGSGSTNWVLTRATDADTYESASPNGLSEGSTVFVQQGATGAGETYTCNTTGTIVFGTTNITFAQISSAQIYSAGTGLTLNATTFSITNTGVTAQTYGNAGQVPQIAINAQGQITSASNVGIAITAANVSGLAASATTDTTNASNITTGTLLNARTTATASNGASTIIARDINGSFAANLGAFVSVTGDGSGLTALNGTAVTSGTVANARTTAASANGASTIVARDASGNFAANVITATTFSGGHSGSGANLTSLNASEVTSGVLNNIPIGSTTANTGRFSEISITTPGGDADIIANNDVSSWIYADLSRSVATEETGPTGLFFKSDGTAMYITGTTGDDVTQYTLAVAWDISTAGTPVTFSGAAQDSAPQDLFFKPDGLVMYIVGSTNDAVYQYTLGTAWDITTASYANISFSVLAQESVPQGIWFKPDGTSMYIVGSTNDTVYQYTLGTAWDLSTASYASIFFSVLAQDSAPTAINFNAAGTVMYILGSAADRINQYALSTAWDISTAVYVDAFYVGNQEQTPNGLFIALAQNYAYVCGATSDSVFQYDTNVNSIQFESLNVVFPNQVAIENGLYIQDRLAVGGTFQVYGSSSLGTTALGTTSTGTFSTTGNVTASTTTGAIALGTSQTTGPFTVGGTAQTGTIILGQSTATQILNLATGATTSGNTKTLNIGTAGVSGSTTLITIGSNNGTTVNVNGISTFSAGSNTAPSITTAGDTNTGIFFPAADTIAFTEGGVESMRIDSAGNVGIGTNSPSTYGKFVVFGGNQTNVFTASVADTSFQTYIDASTGEIRVRAVDTSGANNSKFMTFYTQPSGSAAVERVRITSAGNVGIGTNNPSTALQVNGTATATTFSGSGASLTSIPNSATTATNNNGASTIVARDASGNFTANTATFTGLTVSNTISGSVSGNAGTATTATTANALNTGNSYTIQNLTLNATGAERTITWTLTGRSVYFFGRDTDDVVGLYDTVGGMRFTTDTSGNFVATGNVTAFSDERKKKDWANLPTNFIERLATVKHGTYTRIDTNERQVGASAQSIKEVLPEAVLEDAEGNLSLAYGNAALVAAIELAKQVVELKKEIELLKAK